MVLLSLNFLIKEILVQIKDFKIRDLLEHLNIKLDVSFAQNDHAKHMKLKGLCH